MKKKKILAMFLTIAMAASMAACGGSSEPASGGGSASESGETAAPGEEKLSSRGYPEYGEQVRAHVS